ncbi:FAD/NAD(P)-binding domain-containing protein [Zopfia rhizophila CBS 207.26]|uniref:FAD/NAD(P)-binding domain-containing protein n=1 Tax=Zopfia rhizophila CBS 207.26 TaxID=1314779 RepID=A0A6A6EKP5_9PEZI|nr:FAD/NAD(P)-binding domain-containing protein [Zopfia rhizophila CBS 207.26]
MAPARVIEISGAPGPGLIPASDAIHENTWYNQDFDGYRVSEQRLHTKRHLRIICVGAGAAGLQIAYKAERVLENVDLQIYEKNFDVGGTCEEIWQYFKDVATKYDLEKYVKLKTTVEGGTWDEESGQRKLRILNPEGAYVNDCAKWDNTYDLTNKTVAVIGGASSAVQIVPSIQPKTRSSRELIANMMEEGLNHDEKLTTRMIPDFAVRCRRMTPGSAYLRSLTKENVEVIQESAVRLTETGIVDESSVERELDAVICATGFNTSFTPHFQVTGRNGADIKAQFGDFSVGYLGITAKNFPNLFCMIPELTLLPHDRDGTKRKYQILRTYERGIKDLYNYTHELTKRLVWSSGVYPLPRKFSSIIFSILKFEACRSWFKNGETHGPVTAIYSGSRLHFFEVLQDVRWEDYELEYRMNNRFQFLGNGYTQCEMIVDGDLVWYFDDPFTKI